MIKIMLSRPRLVIGIAILSSLAAAMEGVGITALVPLLQGSFGSLVQGGLPFPFNQIIIWMTGITLQRKLIIVAVLLLSCTVFRNIFLFCNAELSVRLRGHIIKTYRMRCMDRLLSTGMAYLNKKKGVDFQIIISEYMESRLGDMIDYIFAIQPQIFSLIILVLFLFSLSFKFTLISFAFLVVSMMIMGIIVKQNEARGLRFLDAKHQFGQVLFDVIFGMKLVRMFGREQQMRMRFEEAVDEFNKRSGRTVVWAVIMGSIFEVIAIIVLAFLLFVSALVIKDASGLGTLFIFMLIWSRMIPPIKSINLLRGLIVSCLPALKEVERFLQESEEATVVSGRELFRGFKDMIEFRDVNFRYSSDILPVLDRISFTIKKGTRVGIVGVSGSGKSTIVEVLLRFYDPQGGWIKVDNRELNDFDVVSWRKAIGFVSQDVFLFHDTVRANITFSDPKATQEAVEKAARRAHAHEFIVSLPFGYDTRIGDRGVLLSGGEKQRIAIARAILNEPEILIFDEATSALDTESEQIVQQAIEEISKGKTVISIAHRLSTVASSDMIIVIDKGKIIESGPPKELLSLDGIYKKFIDLQSINLGGL